GVFAFLNRSYLFTDKAKQAIFAEKAEGDVTFLNVFDAAKTTKSAVPRLPGDAAMTEATFAKGQEYVIVPAKDVRPVPKVSRRARLAERLASRDNPQFARASANRLLAMMLGRGLVHPFRLAHEANLPSHSR